jgi:branched-chain amino acid transport system ATP-binding protein
LTTAARTETARAGEAARERPPPLLSVEQLSVVYARAARAVDALSFTVGTGEVVALLGPNGAGKTTTVRALTGFLPGDRAQITGGEMRLDRTRLDGKAPHRAARLGASLVAERDKIFVALTVEENLRLGAMANPRRDAVSGLRAMIDKLFPILNERRAQVAGYLSGGQRQMLAIASALLSGPRLLIVDELSLGLAPKIVGELVEVLRRLNREQGLTILLVEQSALVAFALADYVYVLDVGRSVLAGRPDELRARPDFRDRYLGLARSPAAQPTKRPA